MSSNPFNEQVALARQVLTVFDSDKLIEQLRVFVEWVAEADVANKDPSQRLQELQHQEFETADDTRHAEGGYLRKKKELDAIVETSPQKTTRGVSVRRKHLRELKRKYDRLHDKLNTLRAEIKDIGALLEPNPWTLLTCLEPLYSTDAHITKLVRFFFPSGRVCELNASRWVCLLCVRLSILHDSVLPNDYPQLTAKVLDKERVGSVWRDMSGDWLTWRQALEYNIKRLQSDTDTQGLLKTFGHIDQKPNGAGRAGESPPQKAGRAGPKPGKPSLKGRFTFNPGQALFDGKDLELPSGGLREILEKLINSFGRVVADEAFNECSSGAGDTLCKSMSVLRNHLVEGQVPCEIKRITTVGYVIRELPAPQGKKKRVRKR